MLGAHGTNEKLSFGSCWTARVVRRWVRVFRLQVSAVLESGAVGLCGATLQVCVAILCSIFPVRTESRSSPATALLAPTTSFAPSFWCSERHLAQITITSLRIFVWYAKSTHRTICRLCGVVGVVRRTEATDRLSDNGAGQSLPIDFDPYWPKTFEVDADGAQGSGDGGGLPWEPLVPRLLQEAQRLAAEGKGRPLTSAAILAAVLPFSGVAVFFGAPVLAGDAALQWGASTAVGRTIGQGTKNAVEVRARGRLCAEVAVCGADCRVEAGSQAVTVRIQFVGFRKDLLDRVHARASREFPCPTSCTTWAWPVYLPGIYIWYIYMVAQQTRRLIGLCASSPTIN